MRNFIRSIFSVFVLVMIIDEAKAQSFTGIATYKTSGSIQISMDSTEMPPEQMKKIQDEFKRKMQKEYTLSFNTTESSWKQVESLNGGPAQVSGNGIEIMVAGNSAQEVLYKNLLKHEYERGEDLMGKRFIVKDSLKEYSWELTNETKKIGKYNCQKAISTRIVEAKKFSTGMKEMEITQDTIKTEVWFTPDIPVSHGPMQYVGLPGLILEVKTGSSVIICSKVILNPTEPVKIDKPTKGEIVNATEYKAISDKKLEEMMKRYNGGDGENVIEIRTSG
ncbi:GLPGLI family protein [Fulvivirga maritima]|uniref:GLPGLI family protein n=1 Tax=Fulvivirga maritima TaxID=2904247 RepID=UPI001F4873AB|nr:GLPGLI family protein [Fulvivirga maritima]UII27906.1 GLPGLI family protein [Fulvivirga maritima]